MTIKWKSPQHHPLTRRNAATTAEYHFFIISNVLCVNWKPKPDMSIPHHQLILASQANLLDSAAKAYSEQISEQTAQQVSALVSKQIYHRQGMKSLAAETAKKLHNMSDKLFASLTLSTEQMDTFESVAISTEVERHLANFADIAERLIAALRDEVTYRKAETIVAWAHKRYKANLANVNLSKLFHESSNATTDKQQQAVLLHRAICGQPGITTHITNEAKYRREPRFGISPEQYTLQMERSSVKDTIWRHIERMILSDNAHFEGCEIFLDLIWTLGELRDSVVNLARIDEWSFLLEQQSDEAVLRATPKNLPERLHHDLWSRKIPILITLEKPASNDDLTQMKQTLGIDITTSATFSQLGKGRFDRRDYQ